MANTWMVDPFALGLVPAVPVMDKSGMQGGNVFEWMTGSPHVAVACRVGMASAGVACDMLMLHFVRNRLREKRAQLPASAAAPRPLQPPTPFKPMTSIHLWRKHRQIFGVAALVAFIGLCCASWGARRAGASRKRRQQKSAKKNKFEDKLVPWSDQEHEEPDAEPRVRNGRSSKLGTKLRHSSSSSSPRSQANDRVPSVPVTWLSPNRPVASAADEPEGEDFMGSCHGPVPGTAGFVAEQTAEVERVVQIFRMHTEGSVQLVDEDGNEELTREGRVVPSGLVRSCTVDLERRIQSNPPLPRRVSFA